MTIYDILFPSSLELSFDDQFAEALKKDISVSKQPCPAARLPS
jgi:hypothetical protein